ncbi:MAG: glucose-6-phosphate dehydrogenase assembly protein OpcA [Propionicimonas sp.]|uniref:glucose-6-phosphate dehydrogenase assembly protein OpcA n=1 Tax=Propionicimonas sp. TaxID=1955623 RepID=UPI002B1EAB25|nr:glucose-6-phosphate dehydrogenase assembly protein OpcA [Propionicimonas sp.]MEA4942972.1 glucose-6-phosphate dehydrogenase assembly protein OpcA [Propionicimonas sp.]MEA5116932.1 glucose-6-phosphate dehydrogenase assembly protein OpcA [Propionicimonas sp.]
MIIDLPDTSASRIGREILTARSRVGVPTGLVFTMIAVARGCDDDEVFAAVIDAGREHPSRIILVSDGDDGPTRLDAVLRLAEEVPGEIIQLVFHGELTEHHASVLLPLLLPDSPVVVWWPGGSPETPGDDPIGRLALRRITDSHAAEFPIAALVERAQHLSPGDTDLTWTRLTRWRALLAAAVEQHPAPIRRAIVRATPGNAAGVLLAAWLDDRLGVEVRLEDEAGEYGIMGVELQTDAGDIRLTRTDGTMAAFSAPGVPRRIVALPRRDLNALITEELRRLDEDAAYHAAMAALGARWDAGVTKESL